MNLEYDQALALLKQRSDAHSDLLTFARLIDIPSVPVDPDNEDSEWNVVETPLAAHHRLVLHALQGMVDGTLMYDLDTLDPVTKATPEGMRVRVAQTPRPGSIRWRVAQNIDQAPSVTSTMLGDPQPNVVYGSEEDQGHTFGDCSEMVKFTGKVPDVYLCGQRYGICKRVMIMMPPGSAKSTYASVVFPTWEMGRKSDLEVILTGWGDPICRRHGKRARSICQQVIYKSVMGTELDQNTRAAEDWSLTNGSSYKSSGINSGVAGFRCDGLVWDDLTKNRKEADSQGVRNDVYNAYIDDARSRKKPNAWEVGIGTRWHEDEIMGRILPEGYAGESGYMLCRDGNVWLVICLAAQCERKDDPLGRQIGEMIWSEWFGEGYWAEKRVNPRSWASLYQQRPAPEEGAFFKKEWFKRYEVLPHGDNWMSFDGAVTDEEENADADDTVIQAWRVDEFARLYLMDESCKPETMDVWIEKMLRKGMLFKPMKIVGESGIIRRAAEPFLKRAMLKMKAWFTFEWVSRHANKPAMARGAQAMCASGQVFIPYGQLGDDFLDECLRFPTSKKDNRVDAFVNLCLHLESIWDATPPKTVTEERPIIEGGGIPIKKLGYKNPEKLGVRKNRWNRKTSPQIQ